MSTARFKSKHGADVFVNVSEGKRLSSEMCRWHFSFILPIMPDKAAFMSMDGAFLCPATSGATDHKTHGSDHTTDFESRIGSFFGSAKKSCVNY